ncbi:MAG: T9SS type A sorting domain-containing protein [bacterium]|nr:T9SS type A sorting domain-containing protein [bacterium]
MLFKVISLFLFFGFASIILAYSGGPPDGYAFQTMNCTSCHNSFPLNSGNGSLQLIGQPISTGYYTPNTQYQLSVVLEDPGQTRWGFELTSFSQANTSVQMGSFGTIQGVQTVQISDNPSTMWDYVKQTSQGAYTGQPNGPVSWPFMWTAPAEGSGTVVFSFAGNAANNNRGTSGDYIYYSSVTIQELVNSIKLEPVIVHSYDLFSAYPNPFNPTTTFRVKAPKAGFAELVVYNMNGQPLQTVYRGFLSTQPNEIRFNASDLSSGTYIARLQGEGFAQTLKLTLTK